MHAAIAWSESLCSAVALRQTEVAQPKGWVLSSSYSRSSMHTIKQAGINVIFKPQVLSCAVQLWFLLFD
jgi:hypothetical protein